MTGYSVRKANRRQNKIAHMILSETGIVCSKEPTKNLVIGNAGLVTGFRHEDLLKLCLSHGIVEDVIMIPGKSYCFVKFRDIHGASEAYNALHGKVKLTPTSGPLYLAFAEETPTGQYPSNHGRKPPGLVVMEDFVSCIEEKDLLDCIDWNSADSFSGQSLRHRKVKHYGYEFKYDTNNIDKGCPLVQHIPDKCSFLFDRLRSINSNYIPSYPDQLTVNQYQPGQGIPPHIDTHSAFQDTLLSLSLGSSVVMDFKYKDGTSIPVVLPQRSLTIISGEARYVWSHGITPRKMDVVPLHSGELTVQERDVRTSFTFRWIRKGECYCNYNTECDSYQRLHRNEVAIENDVAAKLESIHVHQVYEEIADHFSDTRHKPWPNVLRFIQDLPAGSVLVDIGCGNGKYFGHRKNGFEIGCDHSYSLAAVCREHGFQIFNCDCLSVPLRSNIADACISIAVIHHLASKGRRIKALQEMVRILSPGGKALIYVWAKDQERHKKKSSYLKQDRKNRKLSVGDNIHWNEENVGICSDTSRRDLNDNSKGKEQNCSNKHTAQTDSECFIKSIPDNLCKLPSLPLHTNRTQFQHQDVLVPWKLKHSKHSVEMALGSKEEIPIYYRYYHVFEEGELEELCFSLKHVEIIKSYYDQGNWCIILQKKMDEVLESIVL